MNRLVAAFSCWMLCLASPLVHANGRMPGATGLAIHPTDERQLLLGLTFGLALTRDGGARWKWMCEEQIEGTGGDVDPSIVMTADGTLVAISLTNGGVLVSRDDGCSFQRVVGPMQGNRGMDLTLDPGQPGHVFALLSTIIDVVDQRPQYHNLIAHSLDNGTTWDVLAELPGDFLALTLEVAPSDRERMYVTGIAAADQQHSVVERSDNAGFDWTRTTMQLTHGSGGLYLSGIHPTDPDRLWFREPGRGDVYGAQPARLWLSPDGAASFQQIADTQAGMLGFALSPEGDRMAFGGLIDGLLIGPSDGSAPATKVNNLRVSCLRWRTNGLYACASEELSDPFGLGLAVDPTQRFDPIWHRAQTCRDACTPSSSLERKCSAPWAMIAPLVGAEAEVCEVTSAVPEAGVSAGTDGGSKVVEARSAPGGNLVDASTTMPPPAAVSGQHSSSGCSVTASSDGGYPWWLTFMMVLLVFQRAVRGSWLRSTCAYSVLVLMFSCGEDRDLHSADGGNISSAEDDDFQGCPEGIPISAPGLQTQSGALREAGSDL